jgi:UDP-N-acetylglucosamine acyltransferase
MGSCHIAHDCKIGNSNIFANNTLLAGHVVVEVSNRFSVVGIFWAKIPNVLIFFFLFFAQDCTHTAGAVVVHQFCHVDSFSFLGGGSVVCCLNLYMLDAPYQCC